MIVVLEQMSSTFEFSFVVSGVDPHADDFEDRFFEAGCDDATLMLYKGSVVAAFAREDETYESAIVSAYTNLTKSGAVIERFDPDFLVTASDIAERSSLTRAAVGNYVKGTRGDNFPAPKLRVMSTSPLWDWVDVSGWLHHNGQVDVSIYRDALVSRGVNTFIQKSSPMTREENIFHKKIEAYSLAA